MSNKVLSPSKILSLRVSQILYEEILVECERKNITISEWLERKIAIAKQVGDKLYSQKELDKAKEEAYLKGWQERLI